MAKAKRATLSNQAWWAGLDAHGKEWRSELKKQLKTTSDTLTDKQLDKLLATPQLDLYVSSGGPIALEPLRRFPNLVDLRFHGFKELVGLDVLAELTGLRKLSLHTNNLTDIAVLKHLVNLEDLDVMSNQLVDVSALAGLTKLVVLDIGHNKLTDLSPLRGLANLKQLTIRNNKIADLSPLAGLTQLTELLAHDNAFTDLAPLAGLVNLVELSVAGPSNAGKVTSVAPLGGLKKLKQLDISNHPKLVDLAPLKTCTALQHLSSECTADNMTGFQDLLAIKSLKSIATHRDCMPKKDRDAFKKARPKLELRRR